MAHLTMSSSLLSSAGLVMLYGSSSFISQLLGSVFAFLSLFPLVLSSGSSYTHHEVNLTASSPTRDFLISLTEFLAVAITASSSLSFSLKDNSSHVIFETVHTYVHQNFHLISRVDSAPVFAFPLTLSISTLSHESAVVSVQLLTTAGTDLGYYSLDLSPEPKQEELSWPLFDNCSSATGVRLTVPPGCVIHASVKGDGGTYWEVLRSTSDLNITKIPLDGSDLNVKFLLSLVEKSSEPTCRFDHVRLRVSLLTLQFPVIFIHELGSSSSPLAIAGSSNVSWSLPSYATVLYWVADAELPPSIRFFVQIGSRRLLGSTAQRERLAIRPTGILENETGVFGFECLLSSKLSCLLSIGGRVITSNVKKFYVTTKMDRRFGSRLSRNDVISNSDEADLLQTEILVPIDAVEVFWSIISTSSIDFQLIRYDYPTDYSILTTESSNYSSYHDLAPYFTYHLVLTSDVPINNISVSLTWKMNAFSVDTDIWNPIYSIIIALATTAASLCVVLVLSVVICVFSSKASSSCRKGDAADDVLLNSSRNGSGSETRVEVETPRAYDVLYDEESDGDDDGGGGGDDKGNGED